MLVLLYVLALWHETAWSIYEGDLQLYVSIKRLGYIDTGNERVGVSHRITNSVALQHWWFCEIDQHIDRCFM